MERLILFVFFYLVPFIDSMTGLLLKFHIMGEASIGSPSQIMKFFLWFLLFAGFCKKSAKRKVYPFVLILLSYALLESLIAIFCDSSFYAFSYGLLTIFKVSYLWLAFLFFQNLIERRFLSINELLHLFKTNGLICVSLIFLTTALHINLPTYYAGTFGSKGLFPSGNGISLYVGVLSFLTLIIAKKEGGAKNYLQAFYMVIGSSMIGTKASIIFLLVNFLYFCFTVIKHGKIFVFIFAVGFLVSNLQLFEQLFDVIFFRFKNKGTVFTFIMSSRDTFVKDAFREYDTTGFLVLRIFTGLGAFLSFRKPHTNLGFDTLENDVFDIFFMYGLLGLFTYFGIILFTLKILIARKQLEWLVFSSAIFVYSMIAGHSVFNQTSGVLLALCPLIAKNKPSFAGIYFSQNRKRSISLWKYYSYTC